MTRISIRVISGQIGLRLFEKAGQSNFGKLLTLRIAEWLRSGWKRIIREESFRLSRPMQTIPAIEAVLAMENNDEIFVATLLLESSDAVGSDLAPPYRNHLKGLASGTLPPASSTSVGSDTANSGHSHN